MIIDLDKARGQLDIYNAENDDRIQLALAAATAAVFNLWEKAVTDYVDPSSGALEVPDDVGQAIMLATYSLFYDMTSDPLSEAVRSLMVPHRVMVVA